MHSCAILALSCLMLPALLAAESNEPAAGTAANAWTMLGNSQLGPGFSPGVVYSPELKRFVFFCGSVSHEFRGERPYDVMSLDPAERLWRNELPTAAAARGGETGMVKDVEFKTPYFEMQDLEGVVRPNRRHTTMWYQYAYAPWDGRVYALICGRTVAYDPKTRTWEDLKAPPGPMPEVGGRGGLSWSAMCADPVNKEIVLFGGCGLTDTADGSPGTWVLSGKTWRKLKLAVEPPPRALSPMVFDPASGKILLFGGDRLDQLQADTWLYDTRTRTWEERKPAKSPSPRFGHALVHLPKSGRLALIGGKGYSSSINYCAMLYQPLPFEVWTYDVAKDAWGLVQRLEQGAPSQVPNEAAAAAAAADDTVLFLGAAVDKGSRHTAWLAQLDGTSTDAAATARFGVAPGTLGFREGPFDPAWYQRDVPPVDPAATAAVLAGLPPNRWQALACPKWPANRMGGGWSTVTLDTDRDQLLHMGGGHSAYFGNDMAHYDIKTGRWSIACRPAFALEYNYDLNGPGQWAFNGAPWGNHNYQAYEYDPHLQRVVYIKAERTMFFDPVTRSWPFAEMQGNLPFDPSKYINYLCLTPEGVVCWTQVSKNKPGTCGLWRMGRDRQWTPLPLRGEPLPPVICDGSSLAWDGKRQRLIFTTSSGKDSYGQVWAWEAASGEVRKLDPTGRELLPGKRFAREAVYLAKADLVMYGFLLAGGKTLPFYDCAANAWVAAEVPGAEFFSDGKTGSSVDLGLVYDAQRDLAWGVRCALRGQGALNVLRVDRASLGARPLAAVLAEPATGKPADPQKGR